MTNQQTKTAPEITFDRQLFAPLARTIAETIRDTPVRLGTPEGAADLAAKLVVRVAAYMGSELPTTPGMTRHMTEVDAERQRQLTKWGEQHHLDGTGRPGDREESDRLRAACKANSPAEDNWRDILAEEIAEAFAETDSALLRTELVQSAAVIQAWIHDLDTRAADEPAQQTA
ncbi:NUDIX hydrolase [Streptomyces sp. NPDC093272]|uniref:NUDIX hydrolase n=1 Tax=Streptomyces sp. NPDC093272 TaxID=3154981 RepID=UPI00341B5C78